MFQHWKAKRKAQRHLTGISYNRESSLVLFKSWILR
jgi:hypothetical protein